MSNIDKQAVTAKTKELASLMVERFSMNPVSCKLLNEAWKKEFPDEVAIAERMLALLDELEHYKSREERVTKLVMDNSTSWDALYKKLEAAEKRTAELERANAAQDDHINQQQDRIDVLEKRNAELGKYAGEMERYCIAYMEWSNKTDWVQGDKRFDVVKPLGKHRADVLREYVNHLESRTVTVKLYDDFQLCHYGTTEDYAKGYIDSQNNFIKWLAAAGIKVKGE
ncbi:hypothetical protein CFSAN001082_06336 [Salmonella enterica subsp. enterica serovar Havana str. CFSAN001082]|nr:hypothetical protein CFSAN001082_06336 [Salmonella enterica subsp. enterica serovar Havana str. CFSAN001082]